MDISEGAEGSLAVTVVVPAFDEGRRLPATLERLVGGLAARGAAWEVIVVDDGSVDATAETAARRSAVDPRVRLIQLPVNRGKGAALSAGVAAARGDAVVFCDADLPVPVGTLLEFVDALDSSDAVVASRRLPGSTLEPPQPWPRRWGGGLFLALVAGMGFRTTTDPQCGVKALRRRTCAPIVATVTSSRYAFDIELLRALADAGLRVAERPVRWSHVPGSSVRPVRDGVQTLCDLWRLRRHPAGGPAPAAPARAASVVPPAGAASGEAAP